MAFILALILMAILAPWLVPDKGAVRGEADLTSILQAPSWSHPFGTDQMGRDMFSRVLYGTRISLASGLLTVALGLLVGVPLGAIAGGIGGIVDTVIMRITDTVLSFPPVLLAIVVAAFLGPSLRNAIISIVVAWWPWYTRLIRGQAISMRQRQFVRSAQVIGTPRWRIVFRHILPNAIGPTIIMASLDIGVVILALASLSFLGLGAQTPTPEWGLMINESRSFFLNAPWYMIFPGLAITLTVLAFNIIGDGLREVLDPKSRTL
jgi:peptide/nickel transport system permease protein